MHGGNYSSGRQRIVLLHLRGVKVGENWVVGQSDFHRLLSLHRPPDFTATDLFDGSAPHTHVPSVTRTEHAFE
jgi:hypothetical protein